MAMRSRVVLGGIAVLALATAGFLYSPSIGNVSTRTLAESLARELGTNAFEPCERRGERWTCRVTDRQGSTNPTYRLAMTDGRCWRARKVSRFREDGTPLDRRAEGCARLRDQVRLVSRLLD